MSFSPNIVKFNEHPLHALPTEGNVDDSSLTEIRWILIQIYFYFFRNKLKFLRFLRKRCNVNPARGPFHHRAPHKIFKRAVRGMLPYKTWRGREALKRVRGFEGVPPRYQRVKKQVAPHAMRVICLAPGRKVNRVALNNCLISAKFIYIFFNLVLHRGSSFSRGWMEVPGCCCCFGNQEEDQGICCIRQEEATEGINK